MDESATIRILAVDDHEILRAGITYSLQVYQDLEIVGEAVSGEQALEICQELQPDVVLMDLRMDGMGGTEATRMIRERYPQVQVIALTSFYDKELVEGVMQAGAVGYLIKGASASDLAIAIRAAHSGQTFLSKEATEALLQPDKGPAELGYDLTNRELEVLQLMADGCSNAEIAQKLHITISTTKHHVRAILSKLHANNRAEASVLAVKHNLIQTRLTDFTQD